MSVEVLLNQRELDICLQVAMVRISNAAAGGYKHKYYSEHLSPEYLLNLNWHAAAAEMAAAKWLKVPDFVPTTDSYKDQPDIEPDYEVKHSGIDVGHLIIQENDRNSDRAILVTGFNPYVIRGWLPVSFCKDSLYLKTTSRNTAYWVPQSELVKVYEPVPQN
jgi:hypothetical protein